MFGDIGSPRIAGSNKKGKCLVVALLYDWEGEGNPGPSIAGGMEEEGDAKGWVGGWNSNCSIAERLANQSCTNIINLIGDVADNTQVDIKVIDLIDCAPTQATEVIDLTVEDAGEFKEATHVTEVIDLTRDEVVEGLTKATGVAITREAIVAFSKKIDFGEGRKTTLVGEGISNDTQGGGLRCLVFMEM